jgi:ABC-2 type transport system permease protein
VVLCPSGIALGVRLPASQWLTVLGLLLAGLIPFAVLGILLGHLLTTDSLTPASSGIVTLFALLGGAYGFQLATSGTLLAVLKGLPSYWLVQAGRTAAGGGGWPAEGWIVIAAWTAVLIPVTVAVFRRDTARA